MNFLSQFSLAQSRKNKAIRQPRRTLRLLVENLEDRRLLAIASTDLPDIARDHRSGSLLVQFRDGASTPGSLAAHMLTTNVSPEWELTPGMRRVEFDTVSDFAAALAAFKQDPNVLFAEPDYRISLQQEPNDPGFSYEWGLHNTGETTGIEDADIDALEAWDVTPSSPSAIPSTIVAVIDTGVDYNHPDLKANIWTNTREIAGNGKDDDGNGYVDDIHGYDFVNRDGNPMDDHFHGTHVAGTIAAVGDNGIGVVGVVGTNWNVKIMALKFLDGGGGGYESDAISALNYAVANGADISNNSWGGLGFSAAFQTALQNAATKGHIFVAAAGNDGWNNDRDAFYPASYNVSNVVAVAATDRFDNLAWFSNYGTQSVDLAAPGVDIYSTFPTTMTPAMQEAGLPEDYATISGTSMAAPHVAGVMALVMSAHPEFTYEQVIARVLESVDIVDGAAKTTTGGRLNAANSLGAAPPDTTGPRVLALDPATVVGSIDRVRIRFNEAIDPLTLTLDDVTLTDTANESIAIASVTPVPGNSRQFDVKFASQTILGEYTLLVGPDIADLAGNLLDQDRNGTGGEPSDSYTGIFSISNVLSFGTNEWQLIDAWAQFEDGPTVSILEIGQNISIADLNVQLTIDFEPRSYSVYQTVADLEIYLESPAGTRVRLVKFNDADGSFFTNTMFDDEANSRLSGGHDPYTGSFRPNSSLSAFDGENASGTWSLVVSAAVNFNYIDFEAGIGELVAWSIDLAGDGGGSPPPPPTDPPPGNQAPMANPDQLTGEVNTRLAITQAQLLANDVDPNDDDLTITLVGSPTHGTVAIDGNQLITFTPDPDFEGTATFVYLVSDGFLNDTTTVSIDFAPIFEWHNTLNAADVDKDTQVTATDVVTIINFINAHGSTSVIGLSSGLQPNSFYDVTADNSIGADDVLAVINYINANPTRPTSTMSVQASSTSADVDAALLSLLTEGNDKRK